MKLHPSLKRGTIRAHPEHFDLSQKDQEHYRVHKSRDHDFIIRKQIHADVFGVDLKTLETLHEFDDDLNIGDQNRVNEIMLPI